MRSSVCVSRVPKHVAKGLILIRDTLRPHQLLFATDSLIAEYVEYMCRHDPSNQQHLPAGGILAHPMGAGKTRTIVAMIRASMAIDVADDDSDSDSRRDERATLILVPIQCIDQWAAELLSYGISAMIWRSKANIVQVWRKDVVVVASSTLLRNAANTPSLSQTWRRVVYDEAHDARNDDTKTFKSITSILAGTRSRWLLTATPFQNCVNDYVNLLGLVGLEPEEERLRSDSEKLAFIKRNSFFVHSGSLEELGIELPELSYRVHKLRISERHAKLLEELKAAKAPMMVRRMALFSPSIVSHGHVQKYSLTGEYEDANGGVGPVPEVEGIAHWVARDFKRVCDEADDEDADPFWGETRTACVVFTHFDDELQMYLTQFQEAGITAASLSGKDRDAAKQAVIGNFRAGFIRALVINIACGGVGLNLQVASHAYFGTTHCNPFAEVQAIGRIHRIGQKRPVQVTVVTPVSPDGEAVSDDFVQKCQAKKLLLHLETMPDGADVHRHQERVDDDVFDEAEDAMREHLLQQDEKAMQQEEEKALKQKEKAEKKAASSSSGSKRCRSGDDDWLTSVVGKDGLNII